jgi:hypothetical protein
MAYLLPDEDGVELGKDPEHLVRVLGRTEPVSEASDDLILDSGDAFVVGLLGSVPYLSSA